MKILFIIFSAFMFFGCASQITISPNHQCSLVGLKLDSVSFYDGSSSTFSNAQVYSGNKFANGYGTSNTYSTGENVNCVKPLDENEKAQIAKDQKTLEPILEYNRKVPSYKVWNGLSYGLWGFGGLAAWYYYGTLQDEAIQKSKEIQRGLASE